MNTAGFSQVLSHYFVPHGKRVLWFLMLNVKIRDGKDLLGHPLHIPTGTIFIARDWSIHISFKLCNGTYTSSFWSLFHGLTAPVVGKLFGPYFHLSNFTQLFLVINVFYYPSFFSFMALCAFHLGITSFLAIDICSFHLLFHQSLQPLCYHHWSFLPISHPATFRNSVFSSPLWM